MIKRQLVYTFSIVILFLNVISCSKTKILSQEDMVGVLHDMQIGDAIFRREPNNFRTKEAKESLINGILKKYNITKADLDSSLVYYSDNVNLYMRVNDSITSTLQEESGKVNEQMAKRTANRRIFNFGILPEFSYLTNEESILPFTVDSFKVQRFPNFEVELKTLWMKKGMNADFSISFVYPDTTLIEKKNIEADGNYKISKPSRSQRLKYIYGYVRLNTDNIRPNDKVLLYDISVRDSLKVAKADTTTLVK